MGKLSRVTVRTGTGFGYSEASRLCECHKVRATRGGAHRTLPRLRDAPPLHYDPLPLGGGGGGPPSVWALALEMAVSMAEDMVYSPFISIFATHATFARSDSATTMHPKRLDIFFDA